MNQNPYLERILAEVEAVGVDWKELFSGSFRLQEFFNLVGSLVRAAEALITAPNSGSEKHQLVRDAFDYFDRKYQIVDRIDDLVTLPIFLEPFDGPFLKRAIDFMIGQAVSIFKMTIWKELIVAPVEAAPPGLEPVTAAT